MTDAFLQKGWKSKALRETLFNQKDTYSKLVKKPIEAEDQQPNQAKMS